MKRILISIFILICLQLPMMAGGPWTQMKGMGYFKFSAWWINFDQHYNDLGNLTENLKTSYFKANLYGEYGLTNKLTVLLNAPVISSNNLGDGDQGQSLSSLGDTDLGLKFRLTGENNIPISISCLLGLPLGTEEVVEGGLLQTGDGEFNQIIRLDIGSGFNLSENLNAYVSAYSGFNHRSNDFSNELLFGLEFGTGLLNQNLWLTARLNIVESLEDGDAPVLSSSIYSNNAQYTGIGLEANYYISGGIGVSVAYGGALSARNIAGAATISAGVFYDLNR